MKQTDLAIFYQLGKSVMGMFSLEFMRSSYSVPVDLVGAVRVLNGPDLWLKDFLKQTEDMEMSDSRAAAVKLRRTISGLFGDLLAVLPEFDAGNRENAVVSEATIRQLKAELERFEEAFTRDCKQLDVFTVTPKGDRSTRILLTKPEKKFLANLVKAMPQKTINDLQEAGKCLVFDLPTACAFHICRATEALMLAYYEHLAGSPWPPPPMRKDWANYNNQLKAKGAPDRVTTRLEEIGRMDRNAYAHPDLTVALDEAPIIYDLCTGVMFLMAKEMVRNEAKDTKDPEGS